MAAGTGAPKKVCLIGSGNWGSAVATLIGQNSTKYGDFAHEICMYVYEEQVEWPVGSGTMRKLSEVINEENENVGEVWGMF